MNSSQTTSEPQPQIERIRNGQLDANCYLVLCPETHEALVIDPGAEPEHILECIAASGCQVTRILHTHGHFDHIGATEAVLAGLPQRVPIAAHAADAYLYERNARMTGTPYGYTLPETLLVPDEELHDGDELTVGKLMFEVIHTPGHTPGGVCLRFGSTAILTGDTLFRRGIGRSDLPGGDEEALYESILTRLYVLDERLAVYPGHGGATTIGEEKHANPFVQAD